MRHRDRAILLLLLQVIKLLGGTVLGRPSWQPRNTENALTGLVVMALATVLAGHALLLTLSARL
jgi:hypothetical protein